MPNKWILHVRKFRELNPTMSYKDCLKEAKKTYKKPESMKGSGLDHARFASEVYKAPGERMDVQDFKYIKGDVEKGMWKSPSKTIIAFRGTQNKQDVKTDAMLAVGMLQKTARYKRDLQFTKENMGPDLELTGHSLGGSIASQIGRELNIKAWAYNPGKSVKEHVQGKTDKLACLLKPKGKKCKKAKLISTERTVLDPVSYLGKTGVNVKHVVPKKINVHSVSNFEMLKD